MKSRIRGRLLSCLALLLALALTAAVGLFMRQTFTDIRLREVEHILHFYSDNIMLRLQGSLNEADTLARTALLMDRGDTAWFERAAAPLLEQEGVRYVCLIEGDTVISALPESEYGGQVGRDLDELSYIYTLAKVVKELVVEGPVVMDPGAGDQEVFLFLQPFLLAEDNAYLGEVVVALDCGYVLEQFGLDYLDEQGYDYELWRVDPQNGGKEVVAVSRSEVDFSHAAKTSFHLPTQWNLSIQPTGGWINAAHTTGITLICLLAVILLLGLICALYKLSVQGRTLSRLAAMDSGTGLYNRAGFLTELDRLFTRETDPVMLFYFVFEGYDQVSQLIGPAEEAAFLKSIPARLGEYIQNPFLAGRLGAANFVLAVCEDMDEVQLEDFSKGLSLELLLKIRLDNGRSFLTARYQYARCRPGPGRAGEEVTALINAYYARLSKESPARMLTEKCRQLIAGQTDVVFDEYTDLDMMELSKTFNQYRKQVEQLAYFDPVFNVGNRPKFLKDAKMLISYDKKRPFDLYCVDICSFSQYNELFSADVGDHILHEVLHRLSRPFGTYLYRINGDVFLGVSLSGEPPALFASRLRQMLATPVHVGNTSFPLQVRIAVCQYPSHGDTPGALLDRVQSVLRFSKASDQKIMVFDPQLDELVRTETGILHRLKAGIQNETLEVWYQPMMHLESGRYTALEALVRLQNGEGGYFSAGQVISLAERNGMVEQLGDYVLSRAAAFMRGKGKALGLARMSVNLSVQQLLVGNSADHLLELIQAAGAAPGTLTLEITESVLIQSIEQASATLDKLRQAGIRIALDDFGVGYSSLNYLSNLPVDVLKIDRSLTQQILTSPKQFALLRSIVGIAEVNAMSVVAEGVETAEEQAVISASGVQYIQGFYYARPMPGETLCRFLAEARDTE